MTITRTTIIVWLLHSAVACADTADAEGDGDDSAETSTSTSTAGGDEASSTASESSVSGPKPDPAYDCVEPSLSVARPLSGPGYDPDVGLVDPQESYIVSTTQILPRPDKQADFLALAADSTAAADATPGVVAISLAIEPTCGFARTISVWRDIPSMLKFVASDAHAEAIARSFEVGATGRVMHFEVRADEMPITWEAAIARLADVPPLPQ